MFCFCFCLARSLCLLAAPLFLLLSTRCFSFMSNALRFEEYLPFVRELAVQAGRKILEYYGTTLSVQTKSDLSPLTQADLEANSLIVEGLSRLTPHIPVVSEESELLPYSLRKQWQTFWLVDPLDGTREFLKKNNEFTVNIGLIHEKRSVLGVIYAPALGLLYYGLAGRGAFKETNSRPPVAIHTSRLPEQQSLRILVSRSHESQRMGDFLQHYKAYERVSVGSSLKFCFLAEGQAHVYPRFSPTCEWDVAAGDAIYSAARVDPFSETHFGYNKESMLNGPFLIGWVDKENQQLFERIEREINLA